MDRDIITFFNIIMFSIVQRALLNIKCIHLIHVMRLKLRYRLLVLLLVLFL